MIVYTILNNKIVGIRNQQEPYTLLENERGSTEWYLKPFYNITTDEVEESITQQEIDDRIEAEAENLRNTTLNNRESDGTALFRTIRNFIFKKKDSGVISITLYRAIRNTLLPALTPLKNGDWDITQEYFTDGDTKYITPPTNAQLLILYTFIKDSVDTYVLDNY